jgi:hypothetical protein
MIIALEIGPTLAQLGYVGLAVAFFGILATALRR